MKKIFASILFMAFAVATLAPVTGHASTPAKAEAVKESKAIVYKKDLTTADLENALGRKMTGLEKFAFKVNKKRLVKALNAPYVLNAEGGTNGWAIAGFILSFFIGILGIIFSVIALGQIKKTGQKGRGLAIAGLIIGVISLVVGIITLL